MTMKPFNDEQDNEEQLREDIQVPDTLVANVLAKLGLSNKLIGKPLKDLQKALSSSKWRDRADAIRALGELEKQAPISRITEALKDNSPIVRIAALETLGKLAGHASVPVGDIIDALKDPNKKIYATAIETLGKLGAYLPVLPKPIIAALKDDDEDVRVAAIRALENSGKPLPVVQLTKALHDSAWPVREAAVFALGTLGKDMPIEPLANALADDVKLVREAAALVLGDRVPIKDLVRKLKDGKPPVREAMALSLGELGKRAPIPALIDALRNDSESSVRLAAVLALGQLENFVSAESLRFALKDEDEVVCEAAALVIDAFTPDGGEQFGAYRLLEVLQTDDRGTLYVGAHISQGKKVAIQVFQGHFSQNAQQTFLEQAMKLAQLKHPHIVNILDRGVEDGTPFLVMDDAPLGHRHVTDANKTYHVVATLRERYPKGTQVPLSHIVFYVKQVAEALQYAHDAHIIHGNVKPENMLLDVNRNVLLSNFTITGLDSAQQYYQPVISVSPYIAPERFPGTILPASDQYALGITVYEWLCGKLPFVGDPMQRMQQYGYLPLPSLRQQVPTISSAVDRVVMRALVEKPAKRFSSVQEFANALEKAAQPAPLKPS